MWRHWRASSLRGERFPRHDEMTACEWPLFPYSLSQLCHVFKQDASAGRWRQNHGTSYLTGYINIMLPSAIAMSAAPFGSPFCRIAKKCHRSVRGPFSCRRAYGQLSETKHTPSSLGRSPTARRGPLALARSGGKGANMDSMTFAITEGGR